MSFVIDARCVGEQFSGIDRYVLGLLRGLAGMELTRPIKVLAREIDVLHRTIPSRESIAVIECHIAPWSLRSQLALPQLLRKLRCRVYHCPYLYAPVMNGGWASVITIHDLIPHVQRLQLSRSKKSRWLPLWTAWTRLQCRAAEAIITVSDFSKAQVAAFARVPSHRIHRIYNGVAHGTTRLNEDDLRRRFGLRGRLVTYLGRHDPYKNTEGLVRAWARTLPRIPDDFTLVIAGRTDARYTQARRAAHALNISNRVVFPGYVGEDERIALLRASCLFVFPSRHEGFGLPPLEAMAEGVPVIASNATSLPEVLGDAAILIDPDDLDGLAGAIVSVLSDDRLADRLRKSGCCRAAHFTWERCAREHFAVYESLIA